MQSFRFPHQSPPHSITQNHMSQRNGRQVSMTQDSLTQLLDMQWSMCILHSACGSFDTVCVVVDVGLFAEDVLAEEAV